MPLSAPGGGGALARLPSRRLAGTRLWRVYRRERGQPWWFASVDPDDPDAAGRFDLPSPHGACYLGTAKLAAVLEALQAFGRGLLPDIELRLREAAVVTAPDTAPAAAQLTAARARGQGVTAALWAGDDRQMTQQWAAALHRAGWRAVFHGIQHDPTGRFRAVTLFDLAGAHQPFGDETGWEHEARPLHNDTEVAAGLARYGVIVQRSDPELPFVALEDTGLD